MQISDIKNKQIVGNVTEKISTYQGFIYLGVLVIAFAAYAYFFSVHYFELSAPISANPIPVSAEFQALQAKVGLSFDSAETLRKNINALKDFSEPVVGGAKGRPNPFDSYAAPRSTR